MKIGIDIDNTITHTTEMIMHYARIFGEEKKLNTTPDPRYYYLEDALGWDSATSNFFLDNYLSKIYKEMQPKEKAVEVIKQLKEEHELFLITSRNEQFPLVKEVTLEWLGQYDIAFDQLILNTTANMHHFSKLGVCQEHGVELMIEDHHELALELSQAIPVILFDYPYNRHLESGNIIRVSHWNEVIECLTKIPNKHSKP
ncbi:MAG: hypothetical protein PHC92_09900 [Syntrophomonadaceae bacterium]|nr:hypothetical protein [Syntrophomonadaceae bacterium]MDD3023364.1 hypothetical protein [Syntrophomonadaceae bacterium]